MVSPGGFGLENVCANLHESHRRQSRYRDHRNVRKTADLAFILVVQIAAALLQIVLRNMHGGKHQGERKCRQNDTAARYSSFKQVSEQGTISQYW